MADTNYSMLLICTLCPKSPRFSDVSHLLTHISSKSHLSHRFKLQIRAQSEIAARKQLDNFDIWYQENNLDALLADRMAMKEDKKNRAVRKQSQSKTNERPSKQEKQVESNQGLHATPTYRAPVPRMHLWPTEFASDLNQMDDWEQSTMYSTPTTRRALPSLGLDGTPAGSLIDPDIRTPWRIDYYDAAAPPPPDSAKLKGVYWPGMDLFDSATAEMRRMRNQRKDGTILELMMAKSAEIEPNEVSYLPDGEFRASRYIFGPLSTESSPTKPAAPSPKKRRTRRALSDISVNVPRLKATRARKGRPAASPSARKLIDALRPAAKEPGGLRQHNAMLNPLSNFGHRILPNAEENAEFKMTVEGFSRKTKFDIFRERSERSPARTESPIEEHRFDFSHHGLSTYSFNTNHDSMTSPTPLPKPVPVRASVKENREEALQASMHFHTQRQFASSEVFAAQVFSDPSFNPLYSEAYAQSYHFDENQFGGFQDHEPSAGQNSTFNGSFRPFPFERTARPPRSIPAVAPKNR